MFRVRVRGMTIVARKNLLHIAETRNLITTDHKALSQRHRISMTLSRMDDLAGNATIATKKSDSQCRHQEIEVASLETVDGHVILASVEVRLGRGLIPLVLGYGRAAANAVAIVRAQGRGRGRASETIAVWSQR